jgi:hypothetical protein
LALSSAKVLKKGSTGTHCLEGGRRKLRKSCRSGSFLDIRLQGSLVAHSHPPHELSYRATTSIAFNCTTSSKPPRRQTHVVIDAQSVQYMVPSGAIDRGATMKKKNIITKTAKNSVKKLYHYLISYLQVLYASWLSVTGL